MINNTTVHWANLNLEWLVEEVKVLLECLAISEDIMNLEWPQDDEDVSMEEVVALNFFFSQKIKNNQPRSDLCLIDMKEAIRPTKRIDKAFMEFEFMAHRVVAEKDLQSPDDLATEFAVMLVAAHLCKRYFNLDSFSRYMAQMIGALAIEIQAQPDCKPIFDAGIDLVLEVLVPFIEIEKSFLN